MEAPADVEEDPEEAARMAAAKNPVDTHTTIPLPGGAVWIDLDNTIDGARCVTGSNICLFLQYLNLIYFFGAVPI